MREVLGPPPRILAGWVGSGGVAGVGGVDGGVVEGIGGSEAVQAGGSRSLNSLGQGRARPGVDVLVMEPMGAGGCCLILS